MGGRRDGGGGLSVQHPDRIVARTRASPPKKILFDRELFLLAYETGLRPAFDFRSGIRRRRRRPLRRRLCAVFLAVAQPSRSGHDSARRVRTPAPQRLRTCARTKI